MKKITISKAITVKDWKGTSSSMGACLWNASTAGASGTARGEVWPWCCNMQWAALSFAERLSADELSPETEVGPMAQKRRGSNHFICNYKQPPAQIASEPSSFPVPNSGTHLGLCLSPADANEILASPCFGEALKQSPFELQDLQSGVSLSIKLQVFCCNRRLFTAQLLLEKGPQTHRTMHGTRIQNNLYKCTIHENHSICHHLGHIIKSTLIIASKWHP